MGKHSAKSCFNCKWCSGKFRDGAGCDWLYKVRRLKLPPFLQLHDITMVNIVGVTTDSCFPKKVSPETARECKCYEGA